MNQTIKNLVNLQKALKNCDIKTELNVTDTEISLTGTLWNCINGNEELFEFYSEDLETIESYISPKTDVDICAKQLEAIHKRAML